MRRFGVRSWRLLCFPLAFGLAACGSEGSDDGPPARSRTAPTAEPEPLPPVEEPVAPSAPVEVTIEGVTPVAATAASSLGSGDPLGFPAAPSREAPIRLSVADGTSAMIVDGAALVWGDHHEHVPYRVEHSGPVRVAGVDDAIQVVAVAGGVSVLRSDGSVVEAAAGDDGAELTRPRAPPLALLRREPGGQASCGISRRRGGEVHCWGGFGAPEGRARRIRGSRTRGRSRCATGSAPRWSRMEPCGPSAKAARATSGPGRTTTRTTTIASRRRSG
ncbi:MAG: hypothetical protein H6719_33195 [Sandaracinaceae bacterium]|nr:hypothetical protein [Sandaracinaceae bacterium]